MRDATRSLLEIVAGPNGSGKSTFAESYLVRVLNRTSYLNPDIARIKKRVQMGGHHISSKDVLRRYKRSFGNFWNNYRHHADDWVLFDNSGHRPTVVFSKETFEELKATQQAIFAKSFLKGRVPHALKA